MSLSMESKFYESEGLSFDDVLLLPDKGQVYSRDESVLSTHLAGNFWLRVPIVSSPMPTVTEWEMARSISMAGGIGFIHRFMGIDRQIREYQMATKAETLSSQEDEDAYTAPTHWAGCAVGISEGYKRIEKLYEAGCRLFLIDIAHGYSVGMEKFFDKLDPDIKHPSTIIAGNVATGEGAKFIAELGADGIRVGIGNGAACTTREKTGVGVPQITALLECSEAIKGRKSKNGLPITLISCGGIRTSGDISKAIVAGANAVMLGALLAGTTESPTPGLYAGAASEEYSGNGRYVEGVSGKVPKTGSVKQTVDKLAEGLRSSVSYCGARNLSEFRNKARFIRVAPGVREESATRIS